MSAIPLKLLKLKTLTEVPRSEFSELRVPDDLTDEKTRLSFLKRLRHKPAKVQQVNPAKARRLSFNAAVWLSFSEMVRKPVSLWLTYKDSLGENTVLVDEQATGESMSAMLSGNVIIKVTGDVDYIRACCAGVDANIPFVIEDVHVTRLKNEVTYLNPIQQTA